MATKKRPQRRPGGREGRQGESDDCRGRKQRVFRDDAVGEYFYPPLLEEGARARAQARWFVIWARLWREAAAWVRSEQCKPPCVPGRMIISASGPTAGKITDVRRGGRRGKRCTIPVEVTATITCKLPRGA